LGAGTDPCGLDWRNPGGETCQEIYATGLRNPFRMALNPNTPPGVVEAYVNDVGQNDYEEVNRLAPGADFGWNLREGPCVWSAPDNCPPPPPGLTEPIYSYRHSETPCNAITGGAFVPNGVWGREYDNDYLFADYVCGQILRLEPNAAGGFTQTVLHPGVGRGSAIHLQFGPYQGGTALYYLVFKDFGTQGEVRRLTFTSGNVQPTARLTADPTSGDAPLAVTLDGRGSFDPEGGPLTFLWNFGDGSTAQTTSPTATTTHTYAGGRFTASLRVRDSAGLVSSPTTVSVSAGNSPPTATISTPAAGSTWQVNQRVTLTGTATDPEEGSLPASALTWTVLLHHNADHVHPLLLQSGNGATFNFPAPEDLQATRQSYVEIVLEATDSGGLTGVATRDLQPRRIAVTLTSTPTGRRLRVHGEGPFTTPTTLTTWVGWRFRLKAPTPQDWWNFRSWSDGGAAVHPVAPTGNVTYTATYTP
jgi:PKD repeat protein